MRITLATTHAMQHMLLWSSMCWHDKSMHTVHDYAVFRLLEHEALYAF